MKLAYRPELDGVRAIAILAVMMFHSYQLTDGWLGVEVFFVLSGFLITTLLLGEWNAQGTISLRRFYARRARRLHAGADRGADGLPGAERRDQRDRPGLHQPHRRCPQRRRRALLRHERDLGLVEAPGGRRQPSLDALDGGAVLPRLADHAARPAAHLVEPALAHRRPGARRSGDHGPRSRPRPPQRGLAQRPARHRHGAAARRLRLRLHRSPRRA